MNCYEIWWKFVYFLVSEAQKHPYRDRTAELASLTLQREDCFSIIAPQKIDMFVFSFLNLAARSWEAKEFEFLQLSWDQNIISCFSLHLKDLQHFGTPQSAAG